MDIHKEFTQWAVARGVKLNGIATHRFPDRGLGIIAEKKLNVSETNLYAAFIHGIICVTEMLSYFFAHSDSQSGWRNGINRPHIYTPNCPNRPQEHL